MIFSCIKFRIIVKNEYNIVNILAIHSTTTIFKQDNQFTLIPQNYRSFLGELHEVIIFEEIINELDLTEMINSYSNFSRGTSAYHPRMLLKVLFYGYMNQTFSSRKLAKKLKSDLAFMYLAGNNQPNFRTINKFRKDKGEMLEGIFVQIVLKAKELGLISFGTVSLDGTKIYANASKNKKEEVKKEIQIKKDSGIKQTRINDTDKDSRLMQMKRKDWGNGYNPQNTTEKQFILSNTVPNLANDTNELIPAIEKIEKQYGILPDSILADKGYGTEENYEYGKEKNITTYIPHPKYSGDNLDDYKYNIKHDTYENKEGSIFKFKQFVGSLTGRKQGRPRNDEILKEEDFEAKLYFTTLENGKKKYIQIAKNLKKIFKENDDRLYSKEGKEIYKKRSGDVENVFGNIKMNLKFERFSLR